MNKLTTILLFYIFLSMSDVQANDRIHSQALLHRSYGPNLILQILARSTARTTEEPLALLESTRTRLSSGRVLSDKRQEVTPSDLPSTFAPKVRKRKLKTLDNLVLNRLERYTPYIQRYSRINNLDPNLVRAIIYVESGGDTQAKSRKGAKGLMQLMPLTASELGVSNPLDPVQNIFGGTRYFRKLLDRFQRVELALWAYNAGPSAVDLGRLPLETRRFIPKVLRVKSILDQEGT